MPPELTESDVFVLLSKQRRRLLLRFLQASTTPVAIDELADRIGSLEYGEPKADERRSVHLSLHHNHLPRLEDANVIVYDTHEGTVAPGVNFDTLFQQLTQTNDSDRPWNDE